MLVLLLRQSGVGQKRTVDYLLSNANVKPDSVPERILHGELSMSWLRAPGRPLRQVATSLSSGTDEQTS